MYVALCLFRDQFSHVKPIEQALTDKVKFVYSEQWSTDEIEKLSPDIVVSINEHHSEIAECYAYAKSKGIPTLTLQDGILEWRHMFENPLYDGRTGPPLHAPVLADKIACIGLSSANFIGNLGNWHKVELTGMPKMDSLHFSGSKTFKTGSSAGPKTILVLTSSKPWFTDAQREVVLRELTDIKNLLSRKNNLHVIWRVTRELPDFLKIQNTYAKKSTDELGALLNTCDAVITTISTTILEAQLSEKPTAIIDYFNTPNFVGTRWSIRHPEQAARVLNEMLEPTETDKQIQDYFLYQNISLNETSAAQRTAELVMRMIEHSRNYPQVLFPTNLLQQSFYSERLKQLSTMQDEANLPPQNEEVVLLKQVIARLKYQNQKLDDKLKRFSMMKIVQRILNWIRKKIG